MARERVVVVAVAAVLAACAGAERARVSAPAAAPAHDAGVASAPANVVLASETYVGSEACKACHGAIYDRWKRTRMANVVRDPRVHPEELLPDLPIPSLPSA